jgi:hypothetical protein
MDPPVLYMLFCETLVSWGFIRKKYSYKSINNVLLIHDPDNLLSNPWIIHALYMSFCVTWHMDDSSF